MEDKAENVEKVEKTPEEKEAENQAKWDEIQALDLSTVHKKYVSRKSGWWRFWNGENEADKTEAEYRQFLYLLALNPDASVVPWNQDLDDFWHEHILDTAKYAADCQKLFGRFIHHNPNLPKGTSEHTTAAKDTKEMYREAFGRRAHYGHGYGAGCSTVYFHPVFCWANDPLNPLNPFSPLNPLNQHHTTVVVQTGGTSAPAQSSDYTPPSAPASDPTPSAPASSCSSYTPSAPSCSSAPSSSCSSTSSSCSSGSSSSCSSSSCSSGSSCGSSCGGGGGD